MDWTKHSVLITGAGGFIGSHLVELLVREGADVTAFLHYNSRGDIGLLRYAAPELVQRVKFYFGDLRDPQAVHQAMANAQTVFHLGASIGIPYSYVHPHDVVQTNVLGTLNVLSAAREHGVERLIHTSTSEVYGTARYAPIDEAHPLQGQSPYAASKIGADQLAESFYLSFGVPVSIVRPFNTFGPRQSARAVIPTIIVQLLKGKTVCLGALHPTRDFTYVVDTAAAFMAAAASPASVGQVINLGSGREISIGDLAELISRLIGRSAAIEMTGERTRPTASEVERLLADNRKAREIMGWTPSMSFEAGLQATISWIAEHLDLYQADSYAI